MKLRFIMVAVALLLSACESSNAVMSASQKGLGAMSCGEIQAVFSAVERDKYSVEAAKQLGLNINVPYSEGVDLAGYYELAKTTANVALLAQGCTPLAI